MVDSYINPVRLLLSFFAKLNFEIKVIKRPHASIDTEAEACASLLEKTYQFSKYSQRVAQ
jgi:hypothetical protein